MKNKHRHTPGPWWPSRNGIACKVGWIVGGHWHDSKTGESFGDEDADQLLMSCAPDMLKTLESVYCRLIADNAYVGDPLIAEVFTTIKNATTLDGESTFP